MRLFSSILSLVLLTATEAKNDDVKTVDSVVPSSVDVQYNCIFSNLWTRERHPGDYPFDMTHWTRQVLTSHDDTYTMWEEGTLADESATKMAEAGYYGDIIKELESRNDSFELGHELYQATIVRDQRVKFQNPLDMTAKNRYVSVMAKMMPSPDWFSGFHHFDAINSATSTWYKEFTIDVYPYDAGTEEGDTYKVTNAATVPPNPITRFTLENAPKDSRVYLNADGTAVLPVGSYTCTLNAYANSITEIQTKPSYVPATTLTEENSSIRYNCIFENQWNEDRHPNNFPTTQSDVHWTKQILGSHDDTYTMWKEGILADEGVQKMAEAGGTADIIIELQNNNDSFDIGYEKYLYDQDPKVIYEPIEVSKTKHYISAIAKLAPSPDWFSGFYMFNAIDEASDTWYQQFSIPLYPYDAGTENGDTYDVVNSQTVPPQPITKFTIDTVPQGKLFLNHDNTAILPVATYTCTLEVVTIEGGRTESPTRSPTTKTTTASATSVSSREKISSIIYGVVAMLSFLSFY